MSEGWPRLNAFCRWEDEPRLTHFGDRKGTVPSKVIDPWWLAGGIDAGCCIAAYQAINANSLTDSYTNLADAPNYNLTAPVAAPTFDPVVGWTFDGATQYLATGITSADTTDYSMIVQFSGVAGPTGYALGYLHVGTGNGFYLSPNRTTNRVYANTGGHNVAGGATDGVQAIAGGDGYLDGILDVAGLGGAAIAIDDLYIGALRTSAGTAGYYFAGTIQRVGIYNCTLTPAQVAAIVERLIGDGVPDMTIIAIPDTQTLVALAPAQLTEIANWIVANEAALNISLVLHEGDQIDGNGNLAQWAITVGIWDILDIANIPYLYAIGNHDYDDLTYDRADITIWDANLPVARYTGQTWWNGGFYEIGHSYNAYLIIGNYLFMALEFGPRQGVIDWANIVIAANPTKRVFIVTHSHLHEDGTLMTVAYPYDPKEYFADAHNGDEVWDELVKLHPNIYWVQCGHDVPGNAAQLAGVGISGNKVLQAFANWQGWTSANIRLLKIYDGGNRILVRTYNPHTHLSLWDAANRFEVTYP